MLIGFHFGSCSFVHAMISVVSFSDGFSELYELLLNGLFSQSSPS